MEGDRGTINFVKIYIEGRVGKKSFVWENCG